MKRAVFLALTLLVPTDSASPDTAGNDSSTVAIGSRVRVTTSAPASKRLTGTLVADDPSSLTLAIHGGRSRVTVPRSRLATIEVGRRRSHRGSAAARGALAGVLIGAVVGYAAGEDCPNGELICLSRGDTVRAAAILGAPIGAVIGAFVSPRERWVRASTAGLHVSAAPVSLRGRGVGLSIAVAF
jgi:hypothetical protein